MIRNSTKTPLCGDVKPVQFTVRHAETLLTVQAAHQTQYFLHKTTSATHSVTLPTNTTSNYNVRNNVQMELTWITLPFTVRLAIVFALPVLEMHLIVLPVTSPSSLMVNAWPHVLLITMLKILSASLVLLKFKAAISLCSSKLSKLLKTSNLFLSSSSIKKPKSMETPKILLRLNSQWNLKEEDFNTKKFNKTTEFSNKLKLISSTTVWNSMRKYSLMEPWNLNSTLECP